MDLAKELKMDPDFLKKRIKWGILGVGGPASVIALLVYLNRGGLHYIAVHYITFYIVNYITLHYIALHSITLHLNRGGSGSIGATSSIIIHHNDVTKT